MRKAQQQTGAVTEGDVDIDAPATQQPPDIVNLTDVTFPGREKFGELRETLASVNQSIPQHRSADEPLRQSIDALLSLARGIAESRFGFDQERGSKFPQDRLELVTSVQQYCAFVLGDAEIMLSGVPVKLPALALDAAREVIVQQGGNLLIAIDTYVERRLSLALHMANERTHQLRLHAAYCSVPFLRRMLVLWRDINREEHQPAGFLSELGDAIRYFATAIYATKLPAGPPLFVDRDNLQRTHAEAARRGIDIFGGE